MHAMSEVLNQDHLPVAPVPVRMPERMPDPQAIQEDPEVAHDGLIRRIRQMLSSGEVTNHLLKGREH